MKRLYKIIAGLLILSALFFIADINRIGSIVVSSDPLIYLAAGLSFVLIYPLAALRWQIILKDQEIDAGFLESLKVIMMSYGFNKILPFNSGDLARSKLHEKYREVSSHGSIIGSVAIERSLDVVVISIVLALSSGTYLRQMFSNQYLAFLPLSVILTGLVSLFLFEDWFLWLLEYSKNFLPDTYPEFGVEMVESFGNLGSVRLLETLALTGVRWSADIFSLYLIGLSAGLPLGITVAAFVTAVMNIFALMPISPAGIGPVEASGSGALVLTGLKYSEALSIVLLKRGLGLVLMGSLGALVYLYESGKE